MASAPTVSAEYDDLADVLYVTVGDHVADLYRQDSDGLVWRVDAEGAVYGVTIMDYVDYWTDHRAQLIERLSSCLHLAESKVGEVLVIQ